MRGSVKALLVCGALITAGLGGAAPAVAGAAVPSCSATFEGTVSDQWNNPANWSTDKVPGPKSDVCITKASPAATGKIDVHSLQVGTGTSVDFGGTTTASVTISDILINDGDVLVRGTLSAPTIDNAFALGNSGTPASPGNATITSPHLSSTGLIGALFGTLRLTDGPLQLRNGTLTSGILQLIDGKLILSSDISSIGAGEIQLVGPSNTIENRNGGNALASLSSIGQNGALSVDGGGSLAVNGNLVSQGHLRVGFNESGGAMTIGGSFTQTPTGTFTVHFGSKLSIGGTATLGGSIDTLVNGNCLPQDGATATAMTFAARTGMFTTHNAGFNVLYSPTSVGVQYEGPPGNPCG
jgi:hypothetical protein